MGTWGQGRHVLGCSRAVFVCLMFVCGARHICRRIFFFWPERVAHFQEGGTQIRFKLFERVSPSPVFLAAVR